MILINYLVIYYGVKANFIFLNKLWLIVFILIGNLRKKLHNAFHLSMDRPLFRISNAYQFDAKPALDDDGLLTNVHEGLSPSGSKL